MPMSGKASPKRRQLRLARCLLGAVWLVIIVLCLLQSRCKVGNSELNLLSI